MLVADHGGVVVIALVVALVVAAAASAVAVSSRRPLRGHRHDGRGFSPAPRRPQPLSQTARTRPFERVDEKGTPRVAGEIAAIVGAFEPPGKRDPGVEANARLTARVGLLLIMLLFFEGLTIPFIRPLLSWHIFIGLAIIPPVVLKLGSTIWRFSRYYLNDPRYRAAGPPHPLLRALGPLVVVSTVVLFASGVALWLVGPNDRLMLTVHKVSFVLWFGILGLHVVSHILRAVRLAAADSRDAKAQRPSLPGTRLRTGALVVALSIGLVLGVLSRGVTSGWTSSPSRSNVSHSAR